MQLTRRLLYSLAAKNTWDRVGIRRPDHCDPKFLLRFEDRKASSALLEAFEKYQIVHIKGHRLKSVGNLGWKDLVALFESLSDEDKASWCVETPGDGRKGTKDVEPNEFLNPSSSTRRRGYCSFLVQKDKKAYKHLLSRLPTEDPLPGIKWKYPSGAIWMFFGRNPTGNLNLEGRPEHTDSISFDGTWHYQLSGSKKWIIRPTRQLLDHFKNHGVREWDKESRIHLNCEEGDILCIKYVLRTGSVLSNLQVNSLIFMLCSVLGCGFIAHSFYRKSVLRCLMPGISFARIILILYNLPCRTPRRGSK